MGKDLIKSKQKGWIAKELTCVPLGNQKVAKLLHPPHKSVIHRISADSITKNYAGGLITFDLFEIGEQNIGYIYLFLSHGDMVLRSIQRVVSQSCSESIEIEDRTTRIIDLIDDQSLSFFLKIIHG